MAGYTEPTATLHSVGGGATGSGGIGRLGYGALPIYI